MTKLPYFTFLFLLLCCHSEIPTVQQRMVYDGELSGYQYDEYKLVLNKGDIINTSLNSSIVNVVIYSPINTLLKIDVPVTINQTGEYIFRVLLPRAYARRNTTHSYKFILNIEKVTVE